MNTSSPSSSFCLFTHFFFFFEIIFFFFFSGTYHIFDGNCRIGKNRSPKQRTKEWGARGARGTRGAQGAQGLWGRKKGLRERRRRQVIGMHQKRGRRFEGGKEKKKKT